MAVTEFINASTPTVLQKICATRQTRLEEMRVHYPEDTVFQAAEEMTRPTRDFTAALQTDSAAFILECKKASPSKGVICSDFDPVAIARVYQSYAAAISVLTEPDYFQGDFSYLQAVSAHVQVPVLCKDFIFSRYQVALARYFGADAILLMLSVLDDETYRALSIYAEQLGLHILTEVSDADEMRRATALNAKVIGINHRNLRDLSVDLHRSEVLSALAPNEAVLIAESGIETNEQVRQIAPFVNGFLVGGALTAQTDIDAACRRLLYGAHKVCGLTRPAHALMARDAGACFGGLIFAKRSPRCISLQQAKSICAVGGLQYVGVFALDDYHGLSATEIAGNLVRIAQELQLRAIQLHDVPDFLARQPDAAKTLALALTRALPSICELWVAVKADEVNTIQAQLPGVNRWLLDTGKGGSGKTFNWSQIPTHGREHMMLAGGLNAENITAALRLNLAGFDVNSGVEVSPGAKCSQRVHGFFNRLRTYGRASEVQTTKAEKQPVE
ncbi:bifunctional indole-3-glycerol-phosphate synthase TrpC/phosphoribosylanthranilate isomerase TrpF [Aliidiomarina sanyensis]|uniref:Multifunctional fusion protein n=1 Tax=Aliidiomarina sanyensis TaxID=1249555 RepID=A0A432WNC7_9GAMM|nr:bifunctional indole-3-glycerol-phosphate synthase TrpC/phosphoribosylanthranilate isomerase TrpF [Aliidiomarina sanyensis]RUO35302.1 bifunctional indole-3-glycerol-phosphate synthase TrpC/phosphoribosylanthranilate isomerase TrpF [Aliidiomarina sanyensis]